MIAANLRERILSGEIPDGGMLPKQEELLAEFQVSFPSVREALRILETEGLITVHRGNIGGAEVHRPEPSRTAYMFGLVLQAGHVTLADVVEALRQFEPACAAAAAGRPDRDDTVLPALAANLEQSRLAIDDPPAYAGLARQFHVDLVAGCGNATMSVVVGVLESLWTAHVTELGRKPVQLGSFADRKVRQTSLREHEKLYSAVARGDGRAAERLAREHLSEGWRHQGDWRHGFDLDQVVRAGLLRDR
ncbi:MAG TPA: FCD domain-containing protein [Acidimicrobiales bacterium]|jgi:DNA-binding FadR family transcriptional regulator|nr:FCD domain-containing protein [Acidimicrobiales bacterium]